MEGGRIVAIFVLFMSVGRSFERKTSIESHMLAVNDFALDLYHLLSSANNGTENIFFSPYSIYTALAMTEVGTRENTQKELRYAMNWMDFLASDSKHGGHKSFREFNKLVTAKPIDGKKAFHLANKLWLQKYFQNPHMRVQFTQKLKEYYDIQLGIVNFRADTEAARKKINRWVEKQTNDKIKELLKPGVLTQLTRLVLTNAVYFKDAWKTKFNENRTREMEFNTGEETKPVKMMFVKSKFQYGENKHCKFVELPYSVGDISMVAIVPKDDVTLSDLDRFLSAGVINSMIKGMKEWEVAVRIPKFKLESQFNLNENLQQLGVRDLFDPIAADLSGILGVKALHVSHVIHKAFVDVSEEGTEAAAATAVVATFRSLDPLRKFITADRPFVFLIRHQKSGAILFMGKVVRP